MTLVVAHRGASAAAAENTLPAFRLARELGADWVELDARRTADGVVVVHHDAHLPDGRILAELTADELPESVPNLAEALEECDGMGVNVEIKNHAGELIRQDKVVALCRCGQSADKPFCDGTHKRVGFEAE